MTLGFHCSADTIKPAQSSGSVMSSGSKVVSQSMSASANKAAENPPQANAVNDQPQRHTQKANKPPVTASIMG